MLSPRNLHKVTMLHLHQLHPMSLSIVYLANAHQAKHTRLVYLGLGTKLVSLTLTLGGQAAYVRITVSTLPKFDSTRSLITWADLWWRHVRRRSCPAH